MVILHIFLNIGHIYFFNIWFLDPKIYPWMEFFFLVVAKNVETVHWILCIFPLFHHSQILNHTFQLQRNYLLYHQYDLVISLFPIVLMCLIWLKMNLFFKDFFTMFLSVQAVMEQTLFNCLWDIDLRYLPWIVL